MRARTEEEKAASSDLHKAHWARCTLWGDMLGVHRAAINAHWRCCFEDEPWKGHAGSLTQAQIDEKRATFEPCYKKQRGEWHRQQAETKERSRALRRCDMDSEQEPDLPGRIKVMLWAIKTVGGVEKAKDAFGLAVRSLEDE